ncbi:hypothetical protein SAMN02745164_01816 [Marinitoga hydrogenitolerans DSM 16785]|uniref:Uncharacterized protein n=1 Tax=Marinitoga hydrogenitolerans (strain DSM 16785 / JCM 12826 / AT1271) TaxID=1122195 RepID=A0A1M4Z0U8_MARH1|nr:hypothetical protein [Marinitoga hydrogenitolerans]SHF11585.1 hypothetical protein SAMN02745164_01816 [Marinitoga hydrogenitolerans DSM 16785]
MSVLSEEEKKKGAKSLLIIFIIMFGIYVLVWFIWSQYEKVLNEFKILPTLQIEKANWQNIYSNKEIIETNFGNVEINKIDETTFVIKYKDMEFKERAFRYFNVRELDNGILISFPSFFIRGIKNILITKDKTIEFYKVPTDLQDEYEIYFSEFLLGKFKKIEFSDLPKKLTENSTKKIKVKAKYTNFVLDGIDEFYKISENMYLFKDTNALSGFVEYYLVNAEEENIEEENYILRIFLVEK